MKIGLGIGINNPRRGRGAHGDTTAPVINSSSYDDSAKEIALDLTDASPPITVVWGSVTSPNTATKADLLNGTGNVIENDTFQVSTGSTSTNINVTDEAADEIHYYLIDAEGNETSVQIITGVTIDSTAAVLTSVVDTADGETAATWGVTSDTAAGTIYAGLRLSTNAQLTATEIINTTGNCLQTDTDATPTADANNGGAFSGLTAGTGYTVDVTQDDGFGNITTSVAGDGFTTASAGPTVIFASDFNTGSGELPDGPDWVYTNQSAVSSVAQYSSGRAEFYAANGESVAIETSASATTSDQILKFDIPTDNSGPGFFTASMCIAGSEEYRIQLDLGGSPDVKFQKMDSGGVAFAHTVSPSFTAGAGDSFEMSKSGDTIKFYINGVEELSYVDPTPLTGAGPAAFAWSSFGTGSFYMDNLSFEEW